MVRQILTRSIVYEILGRLLVSTGILIGVVLGIHIIRSEVDNLIVQQSNYLVIANTPVFELPPATPLPTFTPTPNPTATPPSLPAIRLVIPAIDLNSSIVEIYPVVKRSGKSIWEPVANIVGHYNTSGNPGEDENIVLSGHNNTLGDVFRYLDQLDLGDEVILYTENGEFHYQVQKKFFIPYLGAEAEGEASLMSYAAPQSTEMVTLISCWPYLTNSHRIVIVAVPFFSGNENDG